MNTGSRNTILGIASALALVVLSGGCTAGVLVDENFNNITDWRTSGASITFQELGSNLLPDGTEWSFNLNGQPYVSFDALGGGTGATTSSFPGLVNGPGLWPGNYRVEFFQPSVGFAYSPPFEHSYSNSGTCRDSFTGNTDGSCVLYFFELDYNCPICSGPNCGGIQPLPTHDGLPVIVMCTSF
jgi:hypothetical protein